MGIPGPQGNGYAVWRAKYGVQNVKDYGAVGDGTTDDTAAIQAALNVGGLIVVPAGQYKVSATLTASVAGTSIAGASTWDTWGTPGSTAGSQLLPTSAITGAVLDITASFVSIESLTILGNGSTQFAITASSVSDIRLDSIYISNQGGVSLTSCTRVTLTACIAQGYLGSYGFYFSSCSIIFLNRCNASGASGQTNYYVTGGESVNLVSCESNGTPTQGLYLNANDSELYDFELNGCAADTDTQMEVYNCNDVQITRLYVHGTCGIGLLINTVSVLSLLGFWINNTGSSGISLNPGSGTNRSITIMGGVVEGANTVTTNAASCIDLTGINNSIIIAHNVLNGGGDADYSIGDAGTGIRRIYLGNVTESTTHNTINVTELNTVVTAHNVGYNPVGRIPLTASPLVSGTVYQNVLTVPITIYQPVYATTSGTAGSVAVAMSTSTSSPTTLYTQWVNGSTTSALPEVLQLRVPAWGYYSFTTSGATLADANAIGE